MAKEIISLTLRTTTKIVVASLAENSQDNSKGQAVGDNTCTRVSALGFATQWYVQQATLVN
jgi:hypothetical protein